MLSCVERFAEELDKLWRDGIGNLGDGAGSLDEFLYTRGKVGHLIRRRWIEGLSFDVIE